MSPNVTWGVGFGGLKSVTYYLNGPNRQLRTIDYLNGFVSLGKKIKIFLTNYVSFDLDLKQE
jgi:hypothetical protein